MSRHLLILIVALCIITVSGSYAAGSENNSNTSTGLVSDTEHGAISGNFGGLLQNSSPIPTLTPGMTASPPLNYRALAAGNAMVTPQSTPARSVQQNNTSTDQYAKNRVIVKYHTTTPSSPGGVGVESVQANAAIGATVLSDEKKLGVPGLQVVQIPDNRSVSDTIDQYETNPNVEYAEPDYIVHAIEPVSVTIVPANSSTANSTVGVSVSASSVTPNEPNFYRQYGMHNTGQNFGVGYSGTADADIDAPDAWAYTTGSSSIIVAVVDTGVDTTHPDLAANCLPGYNFITGTPGQIDDKGHGTHCAGVIGAIGNNGVGIAGLNWNVKILPCKFLDSTGHGYTSNAISAINYARDQGASVISNSWGGDDYSQALKDAIDNSGAVVVCAAGNDGLNTDSVPQYPSAFSSSNIISVASTDWNDGLSGFSNYGLTTVDVGAPGGYVYSTYPGNQYAYMSGTSMATPHVSGIAALMKARNSSATVAQIKAAILSTVDLKPSLTNKCVTGGRVNAYSALRAIIPPVVAKFYGVPGVVVNPLTIQFHDASTGNPTSWNWNFGDSQTSTLQNPSHTYTTAGTYTVQLTVNNGLGSSSVQNLMAEK